MIALLEKYPKTTLFTLVLLMLLPHLSILEVTIMEARNFITAREMLTLDHWLLTTMNDAPRYEKPPLPTWLSALSASLFGLQVWALRFPAVLMVAFLGLGVFALSCLVFRSSLERHQTEGEKLTLERSQALQYGLIAVTSFYVIGILFEGPWDIYAHTFTLGAIYGLYREFQVKQSLGNVVLAGLCLGAGILSKGPVSLYALFLPFLIAYGMTYGGRTLSSRWKAIGGVLLIGLLSGGWWYAYVRWADPAAFEAIAARETANWGSYNIRPFYYYWSFFTQSGIWTLPAVMALMYPYLKSRVKHLKAYQLTFWWTISAVILLSVIPEKKSRYLMPVLIPLAMNTGFYIHFVIQKFNRFKQGWERIPVYVHFGLLALIALSVPIALYLLLGDQLSGYWIWYTLLSLASLILGVFLLVQLRRGAIKTAFYGSIGFVLVLLIFGFPLAKVAQSNPNYRSLGELQQIELPVYAWEEPGPEVLWDYGSVLPLLRSRDTSLPDKLGVLVDLEAVNRLQEQYPDRRLIHQATYDLNTVAPDEKGRKGRLTIEYYWLVK
ncbi:ArnT family glycosyltransferase [Croceiramulus getboli]|nr:glycosyltransferase family 39 protein [Flavobacteriaceae bacterium YJPT1-3]